MLSIYLLRCTDFFKEQFFYEFIIEAVTYTMSAVYIINICTSWASQHVLTWGPELPWWMWDSAELAEWAQWVLHRDKQNSARLRAATQSHIAPLCTILTPLIITDWHFNHFLNESIYTILVDRMLPGWFYLITDLVALIYLFQDTAWVLWWARCRGKRSYSVLTRWFSQGKNLVPMMKTSI